jgi:hypothetical protein
MYTNSNILIHRSINYIMSYTYTSQRNRILRKSLKYILRHNPFFWELYLISLPRKVSKDLVLQWRFDFPLYLETWSFPTIDPLDTSGLRSSPSDDNSVLFSFNIWRDLVVSSPSAEDFVWFPLGYPFDLMISFELPQIWTWSFQLMNQFDIQLPDPGSQSSLL